MHARKKKTDAVESTDGVEEILTSEEDFDALALPENKYYSKVASVYSAVRYVLLVILVLFVSFFYQIKMLPRTVTASSFLFMFNGRI